MRGVGSHPLCYRGPGFLWKTRDQGPSTKDQRSIGALGPFGLDAATRLDSARKRREKTSNTTCAPRHTKPRIRYPWESDNAGTAANAAQHAAVVTDKRRRRSTWLVRSMKVDIRASTEFFKWSRQRTIEGQRAVGPIAQTGTLGRPSVEIVGIDRPEPPSLQGITQTDSESLWWLQLLDRS